MVSDQALDDLNELTRLLAASREETIRAEREVEGVREELTRQASANQDLQLTLAIRTKALAASQADLTRVEREREEALAKADKLRSFWNECSRHREQILAERDEARAEADLYLSQRDNALHDLARARFHHAHCPTEVRRD